jgi:hypothetical protein
MFETSVSPATRPSQALPRGQHVAHGDICKEKSPDKGERRNRTLQQV